MYTRNFNEYVLSWCTYSAAKIHTMVVLSHIFVTRNYIHVVFQNLVTFHVTVYVRAKSMSVVMMQSLQQGVGFRIYIYIYI